VIYKVVGHMPQMGEMSRGEQKQQTKFNTLSRIIAELPMVTGTALAVSLIPLISTSTGAPSDRTLSAEFSVPSLLPTAANACPFPAVPNITE
jgi:hypothetical protein